ncbi:methionyl-tRNA formyltransferase [Blattabacterium cuenoti]|uniref:methionyl-tRNA formyltransferase n=1 Tax=Blattabacterium cuenoti TaxID=1653831 RepID=UPI00163C5A71|nr:methionyl-tRNA formyltransferase [Blattabacterium cuenoti]
MKKFLKIVFIGSNSFSLFPLIELYIKRYNIIGIITNPDNNFNKNKSYSIIKQYALKKNIPFLQPKNFLDPFFLEKLKKWNSDIQIVVSFKILPKEIWNLPKLGTINLHPSLLPQYRGAAPINWAIINGEKKTGLTVFFIEKKIDSGKIIIQKEVEIKKFETAGQLEKRLRKLSGTIIIDSINKILNRNNSKYIIQNSIKNDIIKYAPKIFSKDCKILWNQSIDDIYNKIRGLSPRPTAWTLLHFDIKKIVRLKIFLVKKKIKNHSYPIGLVLINLKKKEMYISVKKGFINIIKCQIEGKKKMNVKNFINGIKKIKNLFVR